MTLLEVRNLKVPHDGGAATVPGVDPSLAAGRNPGSAIAAVTPSFTPCGRAVESVLNPRLGVAR